MTTQKEGNARAIIQQTNKLSERDEKKNNNQIQLLFSRQYQIGPIYFTLAFLSLSRSDYHVIWQHLNWLNPYFYNGSLSIALY